MTETMLSHLVLCKLRCILEVGQQRFDDSRNYHLLSVYIGKGGKSPLKDGDTCCLTLPAAEIPLRLCT